jgi:hypothetical protein
MFFPFLGASTSMRDNLHGNTPLHWALLAKNLHAVAQLVTKFNADVDAVNLQGKVSVHGVKSLWGDCRVFPRLGAEESDRCHINLPLCTTCQCPWCPISEKRYNHPKVI